MLGPKSFKLKTATAAMAAMRADHEITLAQRRVNTALSLKRVPIDSIGCCCVRRDRATTRDNGYADASKAGASGCALFWHMTLR
jgi:hypothetical protein